MNDFETNPRRQFELCMRPVADDLYKKVLPEIVSVERFAKETERHILDRSFAIDCIFHFKEMVFTCQEKFRTHKYVHYKDITVEYYNDPDAEIKGDWFNMCAQLYFCGYANATNTAFETWVLLDWSRIVLATVRTESETGLRKVRLPNLRYHLSYRRLNKAIQDSRYPEQTNPAFRLVYFLSPDRQRFVPSFHYGGLYLRPMLLKVSAELAHGHPVHSRRTFVAAHLPERTPQIVPLQNLL